MVICSHLSISLLVLSSDFLKSAISTQEVFWAVKTILCSSKHCSTVFIKGYISKTLIRCIFRLYSSSILASFFCTPSSIACRAIRNSQVFPTRYCVNHTECQWENIKKDIELKPTVSNRIDENIRKIENILNEQKISGTQIEQEILQYIANIISVDTMELQGEREPSPLLKKLNDKKKDKIIELAKSKVENFTIPLSILNSNQSINLSVQNKVYNLLLKRHQEGKNIKMPSLQNKSYEVCKTVLNEMYSLYEWDKTKDRLKNENSLIYFATLMNKWVKGFTLSFIIQQSIDYYTDNNQKIHLGFDNNNPILEDLKKDNKLHINKLIENVIEEIEYILRFLLEKYFNHYYSIISKILGEENAGENWATLLEYGTQNRIVFALQNIGISRNTALSVYRKCRNNGLVVKENKLEKNDENRVLQKFKKDTMEYDELVKIL